MKIQELLKEIIESHSLKVIENIDIKKISKVSILNNEHLKLFSYFDIPGVNLYIKEKYFGIDGSGNIYFNIICQDKDDVFNYTVTN
jgi:hypothetical protein